MVAAKDKYFNNTNNPKDDSFSIPEAKVHKVSDPLIVATKRLNAIRNSDKQRCVQTLKKLHASNNAETIKHPCMVCHENSTMALRCGHLICESCWENHKHFEGFSYYELYGNHQKICPTCQQISNQHHRCPICQIPHAANYEITELL
jgi:hypothetical protein